MKYIQQVETEQLGFHERLQRRAVESSGEKTKHDGSVTIKRVKESYFLVNDIWDISF